MALENSTLSNAGCLNDKIQESLTIRLYLKANTSFLPTPLCF